MKASRTFQDLLVWQKPHRLVLNIYKISQEMPKHELFGLTSQLRRAAVSVPANIAEGFSRASVKDKLRFYCISQSSLEEVRYYSILIHDLQYAEVKLLSDEITRGK
jgi:four helix bundle protein